MAGDSSYNFHLSSGPYGMSTVDQPSRSSLILMPRRLRVPAPRTEVLLLVCLAVPAAAAFDDCGDDAAVPVPVPAVFVPLLRLLAPPDAVVRRLPALAVVLSVAFAGVLLRLFVCLAGLDRTCAVRLRGFAGPSGTSSTADVLVTVPAPPPAGAAALAVVPPPAFGPAGGVGGVPPPPGGGCPLS